MKDSKGEGLSATPATALPWHVSYGHKYAKVKGFHNEFVMEPHFPLAVEKDATYIVHACNAYPRLVEFVRQFAELQGPDSHLRIDSEAFFRELGEPWIE